MEDGLSSIREKEARCKEYDCTSVTNLMPKAPS